MGYNLFTSVIPTLGKDGNRLSGWIPSSIGNLTRLYRLYLYVNELEGSIPPNLENCKKLQEMDLSHNRLSGNIPPQVLGLSSLV